MNREKIISREYKVVLNPAKFTGNEQQLKKKAALFWKEYKSIIEPAAKECIGNLDTISIHREIRFYDTSREALHSKDYIFRERKDLLNGENEVTLKFRHPDRYISQDRDMLSRKIGKGETKFEEDIKAPFIQLYSYSSTQPIAEDQVFEKIKHIIKLYPGLKELFADRQDEKVSVVNDIAICEMVITGANMILSTTPEVRAECALIAWYDLKADPKEPVIMEFSFRHKNKKEKFSGIESRQAYEVFKLIQDKMKPWLQAEGATKTGFIFDHG